MLWCCAAGIGHGDHGRRNLVRHSGCVESATTLLCDEHGRIEQANGGHEGGPRSSVVSSASSASSARNAGSACARSSRRSNSSRLGNLRRAGCRAVRRATALPLTVTVISSPAWTRRSSPAVSLRSSREATSDIYGCSAIVAMPPLRGSRAHPRAARVGQRICRNRIRRVASVVESRWPPVSAGYPNAHQRCVLPATAQISPRFTPHPTASRPPR